MIKIAVCDDDRIMLDHLAEKIGEYYAGGCEIRKYENGEGLLSDIRKQIFDVLFLDIDMPGMDGMQLAEKIRDGNGHVKIIFVTNKDNLVYKSIKYTPFRYIRKSHMCEELQEAVKELEKALSDDSRTGMFATELGDICIKLKEITYIHSEAYAAGELKHGTISLITDNVPVIALATQPDVYAKIISNVQEVRSRGARVILITGADAEVDAALCDYHIVLPDTDPLFAPFIATVVLQYLAYYVSVEKGLNVDQPRNLAKSVTVE